MKRIHILLAATVVLAIGIIMLFLDSRVGQNLVLERMASAAMSRPPDPAMDGLRVFMCGTSSPFPARNRVQTCVAVSVGDQIYIVDAGAGSARTATLGRLPLQRLRAILLTHFHSDHIAAIGDFNLNSWVAGRPEPLEIIGPQGVSRIVDGYNTALELDRGYRVAHHGSKLLPPSLGVMQARTVRPGTVLKNEGFTISMFSVDHSPVEPAVGYRFDYRGRSVVISGDTVVTKNLADAATGADLLLHDGMSLPIVKAMERAAVESGLTRNAKIFKDIQDYHAANVSLKQLVEETGVKQLAIYHLVPSPQNLYMERIFKRDLPKDTILTRDGMVFELPANSREIIVRN